MTHINSIFAGFDDHMEAKEPGWKAARAKENAERERKRLERVASVLARYGGEEAALAPCERETKIRDALGSLVVCCEAPHQRWTASVAGFRNTFQTLPQRVLDIVARAYPLPVTFREALTEDDYWQHRRQEMEDVLGYADDDGLDLVAQIRAEMVHNLARKDLRVTNLVDLHARFRMHRESEVNDKAVEDALFRDLTALATGGAA